MKVILLGIAVSGYILWTTGLDRLYIPINEIRKDLSKTQERVVEKRRERKW